MLSALPTICWKEKLYFNKDEKICRESEQK